MSSPTAEPGGRFHAAAPPGLDAEAIQRRQRLQSQWRRHSFLIHSLRRILPAAGICLMLALLAWGAASTLFWRLGAAHPSANLAIRMLRPNFQGRDEKGKPYLLSADSAVRDDVDSSRVTLEAPVFTLGSPEQGETHVRALHGIYREDTRVLNLTGQVHLDDSAGNHFVTEHAVVDMQKNSVDGELHIEGQGPLGRIAASSYAVRDGGAHVFFTGQVKARIEQRGAAVGAKPAPAKR
jgi:lipopolysaccharide export system protein LptC